MNPPNIVRNKNASTPPTIPLQKPAHKPVMGPLSAKMPAIKPAIMGPATGMKLKTIIAINPITTATKNMLPPYS